MNIRKENGTDSAQIEALVYQAFENHPHHEPGAKPTEHLIVNRLRDNGVLTLSLVAEDTALVVEGTALLGDGIAPRSLVGHIAFSPVMINGIASNWFGLGPVAVTPDQQGKGIGRALIEAGIARLKDQGADGLVLLGEPDYYHKFGFEADNNLTLADVPAEYFLVKPLNKAPVPVGEVSYHSSFYG